MTKNKYFNRLAFFMGGFWDELRLWRSWYLVRRPMIQILLLTALVLLILKSCGILDHPSSTDPSHFVGSWVTVTGLVNGEPDPNPRGVSLLIKTETVQLSSLTYSSQGLLEVELLKASDQFAAPGDRLRIRGRLQRPKKSVIPGTFNYSAFLANKNIYSAMFTSARSARNTGDSGENSCSRLGWKLQNYIVHIFDEVLNPDQSAVLSGLVVGRRPRFHPEIRRIFIETGTMHILVASGSNVAFVVALWFFLVRLLFRLSNRWALLTSLPAVWVYSFMAGGDPPILRAAIMTTVGLIAYILRREDRVFHALSLAALILLIISPKTLFEIGFQMSFLTVFGLLYFLPTVDPWFQKQNILARWCGRIVGASATAQIWLLPISLSIFKRFYPFGIISNILILPLSAGGLYLGFLLVLATFLHRHLPHMKGMLEGSIFLTRHYLDTLLWITRFSAAHISPSYWMTSPGKIWTVGYYGVCLSVVKLRSSVLSRITFGLSLLLLGTGWMIRWKETQPPATLQATWISVGRSFATLLEFPGGARILVTPTIKLSQDQVEKILMPFLTEKGIRQLTVLAVLRSTASDDGLAALQNWCPANLVLSENATRSWKFKNLFLEILPSEHHSQSEPILLVQNEQRMLVLSKFLSLQDQDTILTRTGFQLELLQTRFSPKLIWDPEFVKKCRPEILVESGINSLRSPSQSPWREIPMVVPTQSGFFVWRESSAELKRY